MPDRTRTAVEDWGDIRFFLALARAGSLSAAARDLHVHHATVSRRIAALEAALGQPLFHRRADGYDLTMQGQAALKGALAMERSATELTEALGLNATEGVVRLATVRSLADAFLAERLGPFARTHPGIRLDIVTDRRPFSLARREADVALRIGRPKDSALVGRRVAMLRYAFYAAPERVSEALDLRTPAIGYGMDEIGAIEAAWIERCFSERTFAFRADSPATQAAAVRAGLGVALLPCYLARGDPGLVEVEIAPVHPPRELWLLSPPELARVPRVRAVLDAVAALVEDGRRHME